MNNGSLSNLKVLLVEDEASYVSFLSYLLDELGIHNYIVSGESAEAIDQFHKFKPDLALLDIDLKAAGTGIDVARVIKSESDVPIIFIAANCNPAIFESAKKFRPQAFLDKEVNKTKLRQAFEIALQNFLDMHESRKEVQSLAYIASHDLKGPLRAITSFTDLLERELGEGISQAAKEYLDYIKQGGLRMNGLITGILENASLVTWAEAHLEKVALDEVLDYALDFVHQDLKGRRISVKSDPLPTILSNRCLFEFLFKKLIHNGLKFNRSEVAEVRVSHQMAQGMLHLFFADNGIGIAAEEQAKIFEMFQRVHSLDEYRGAGMALALCRKVVGKLGGTIDVESQLGHGSVFRVSIPLLMPAADWKGGSLGR